SWSFTTATAATVPYSFWGNGTVPGVPSVNDPEAVELGVKFHASVDGTVTALRFYKGNGNLGTHVAHLWTSTGQLLATAEFANETAGGWQQVDLATPVAVSVNTTYV